MANEHDIKINAVLFDYGMVLSGPPDPVARQQMEHIFTAHGVDQEAFQGAYWKYRDAYDRGTLAGLAYWQSVALDLNVSLGVAELRALIDADNTLWTQPNLPMIEWAATLQASGLKTGVLSNIGDAMEAGILAHFPWLAAFTHHTFSHRLGIAKPDQAIYLHAAEGLGVPIAKILFIDDREENIIAARAAGMVAVQYIGHDAFIQEMLRLGLDSLLSPELPNP